VAGELVEDIGRGAGGGFSMLICLTNGYHVANIRKIFG
jgi:hypothetical protein